MNVRDGGGSVVANVRLQERGRLCIKHGQRGSGREAISEWKGQGGSERRLNGREAV
jgi:hypothetical protein